MIPQVMAMHRTCQLALSAHLVESVSPTARWTQRARQRSHLSQTLHHLFARSPPACSGTWCCSRSPPACSGTCSPPAMAGSSYFQKTLKGDGGHIRTLAMHRLCTGYAQAMHRRHTTLLLPESDLLDGGYSSRRNGYAPIIPIIVSPTRLKGQHI